MPTDPEMNAKIVRRPGMDFIADHMNRCRHFTGLLDGACGAGVRYMDVAIEGEFKYRYGSRDAVYTAGREWPCRRDRAETFGVPPCPKAEWPTREEAEAEKAEIDGYMDRVTVARKAIVASIASTGKNVGSCECPTCKGVLHYRRATSKGHIHAKCETPDCVAWME